MNATRASDLAAIFFAIFPIFKSLIDQYIYIIVKWRNKRFLIDPYGSTTISGDFGITSRSFVPRFCRWS